MNRLYRSLVVIRAAAAFGAGLSGLAVSMSVNAAEPAQAAKPDVARGQAIATQVCAACHAADGNSAGAAFPKLAGQHAEYIVKQLKDYKTQPGAKAPARNNPIMAGIAGALSDQDMVNVAAYFASQKAKPNYRARQERRHAGSEDLPRRHRGQGRTGVRRLPRRDRHGYPGAVSAAVVAVGRLHGGAVERLRIGTTRQQRADAPDLLAPE